jgi:hypothetical protein
MSHVILNTLKWSVFDVKTNFPEGYNVLSSAKFSQLFGLEGVYILYHHRYVCGFLHLIFLVPAL